MTEMNIELLMNFYDDETFLAVKNRFIALRPRLMVNSDKKLETVMHVLFDSSLQEHLTRHQFTNIINSLFYEERKKERWCISYMERLLLAISDSKRHIPTEGRAKRYSDRLIATLNEAKDKKSNLMLRDSSEIWDVLVDYVKFVLGISSQMSEHLQDGNIMDMNFDFGPSDVEKLTKKFFLESVDKSNHPEQDTRKGIKIKMPRVANQAINAATDMLDDRRLKNDAGNSTKLFYLWITWMIYYRICQEDGIRMGE